MRSSDSLAEVSRKYRVHPLTILLLQKWRGTPDCKRFIESHDLRPQFGPPNRTQAWARMSLDWIE